MEVQQKVLTPDEWAQWKSSPTTLKFFEYLRDFRTQIADEIADLVAHGVIVEHDAMARDAMRCDVLLHVEGLTAEDVNFFYQTEKEEKEDGSNTEQ